MANKAPLGVCIVGCGFMGGIHAAHWHDLPEAKIIAVVDILPERAAKFAELYALPRFYTDYQQALALPEVDVVSVCVPTCLHAEITLFASRHRKHILTEKPIALTLEQAQAMITAAQENQVKLGVGFMRRHSPVLAGLRDRLASGDLGRPVIYHSTDFRQIRPKLAMHDARQNGGPAIDMAVHLLDSWAYIFQSKPVEVYAQGLVMGRSRPELASIQTLAPDTASLTVRYESGDIGSFVVCWGLPPGANPPERPDQICAPGGFAEVTFGMTHQEARLMKEGGQWEIISTSDENMYQREIASMARYVLHHEPFPASGEDGLSALRTALAAIESIHTGKPVHL
ncbi:MAG: Gfo/Idh/MocA family oxidoreductase [Anaerolineales bacterium]|nr:Gfo/Idh/MocA family oxidoreductase [Anaerolineales bacterium]